MNQKIQSKLSPASSSWASSEKPDIICHCSMESLAVFSKFCKTQFNAIFIWKCIGRIHQLSKLTFLKHGRNSCRNCSWVSFSVFTWLGKVINARGNSKENEQSVCCKTQITWHCHGFCAVRLLLKLVFFRNSTEGNIAATATVIMLQDYNCSDGLVLENGVFETHLCS